ncbi:hypothetical protein T07_9417 [Trichinella nelsoni]|uniref:Uncharacterized protein n=1 Tax=Trichinella nelsoni TaxID=6336 RepID=A0A0V0SC94_9BILA|nr:hypothetical protein T07_9417 [Trichinella nelsoni]
MSTKADGELIDLSEDSLFKVNFVFKIYIASRWVPKNYRFLKWVAAQKKVKGNFLTHQQSSESKG